MLTHPAETQEVKDAIDSALARIESCDAWLNFEPTEEVHPDFPVVIGTMVKP